MENVNEASDINALSHVNARRTTQQDILAGLAVIGGCIWFACFRSSGG